MGTLGLVFYVNGYIITFKFQIYFSIYKSDIYINIVPSRNKKNAIPITDYDSTET